MQWFKRLIIKFFKWRLRKKYKKLEVTPQGQYFIKYLIDFYVNCTVDEPIEKYEEKINNFAKNISSLPVSNVPDELKPQLIHYHCAILMLARLLNICDNKEDWLNTIQDEDIKQKIISTIIL